MARVRARTSSNERPRIQAAMSQAATCSEGMEPEAAPAATKASSRSSRAWPSRFLRMRSIMWSGEAAGAGMFRIDQENMRITHPSQSG